VTAPGLEKFGGRKDEEGGAQLPNSKALMPANSDRRRPWRTGRTWKRMRAFPRAFGASMWRMAYEDGDGGEQAWDDGEADRPPGADQGNEADGERGPPMAPRLSMARSNP